LFERLQIPDVILITPTIHRDARGFFTESYRRDRWADNGISVAFVQDNHSLSTERGVIRGLHFQSPPHAQAKLIRCTRGSVFDVAVDIRSGSPTYGRHVGVDLSAANGRQLYVPVGFAHGFCTLEPECELQYKCSDYYAPDFDRGLAFDDPEIAIPWPVSPDAAVLSDKDRKQSRLSEIASPFSYPA
jgi:dTDP-4-dehydrorhamnose 3,5-epimerase